MLTIPTYIAKVTHELTPLALPSRIKLSISEDDTTDGFREKLLFCEPTDSVLVIDSNLTGLLHKVDDCSGEPAKAEAKKTLLVQYRDC